MSLILLAIAIGIWLFAVTLEFLLKKLDAYQKAKRDAYYKRLNDLHIMQEFLKRNEK